MIGKKAEDLMAEYIANGVDSLSEADKRIVDLKVFEKTGKHIAKFKDKKKKPKQEIILISPNGKNHGSYDQKPTLRKRKDPPVVPGVSVNGAVS